MSNYNEVADRLDNERLSVSLGDRQLAARVLRSVATLESQLAAKTAECERVTRKLNFLETEGDEKDGWCEHERLIKQLRTGGWLHHTHCDVRWKWNEATDLWDIRVGECTCGLDAALAKEGGEDAHTV